MDISNIRIIRSKRKTLGLEIKANGQIVVRAPFGISKTDINKFITEHRRWIEKHMNKIRDDRVKSESVEKLTPEQIQELADRAADIIPRRVAHFAPLIGVTYGKITIKNQKTRWGSCSSKGNLNFNCLLMLAPPEVLDSVVVHELCHRKEMNHSEIFYAEVLRIFPDYYKWHGWLKENGNMLMNRCFG